MLELEQRMGKAIEQDRSDTESINKVLQYLLDCAAIPAETVPKGF